MNNKFFQFVETYKDDIKAFIEALVEAFKAIFAKLGEGEDAAESSYSRLKQLSFTDGCFLFIYL